MDKRDKILGALYGQAIGDAMGMPSELWPIQKIQDYFKGKITTFLDGPKSNDIALNFTKGQYTDDTNQAFVILDALIENHFVPDTQIIVNHLQKWAKEIGAFENNILGPSSKAALLAIEEGRDPLNITKKAETNGAGMRISPIGSLFDTLHGDQLVQMVFDITKVTHSSDVAISGAAIVAGAVSAAVEDKTWDEIIKYALSIGDQAKKLGAPTWNASCKERAKLGIELAKRYQYDEEGFSQAIYDLIGTGTMASESIPAAVSIAYYTRNVRECALFCANLGGDTDTIGAMATAICGAKQGFSLIPPEWTGLIDSKNPQYHISYYADQIMNFRNMIN